MDGFKKLPKMKSGGRVKRFSDGGSTSEYHPLVQKGLREGYIHPADARWMSDYANTKGDTRVETGKVMKDQSERMENFLNRIKRGEVANPWKGSTGGGGGGGGAELPKGMIPGGPKNPSYKRGGRTKK